MKKAVLFALILLIIPVALAKTAHMPLLAVKETKQGIEGSIANLYLDIAPGTGRVFIETFPLTKFDTQISTRFAKEVVCDYLDINCKNYDFFYTIRADSPIVGGPSAGAAVAVLTAASLLNLDISKSVVITGTINAGGLIGPVGGLMEKLDAASTINITTVLIPKGEIAQKIDNITIELANYAEGLNIKIIEVANLNDAMYYFTGRQIKKQKETITVNNEYTKTMAKLAKMLCNRSQKLADELEEYEKVRKELLDQAFELAQNLTKKGKEAYQNKRYYSAASYCFGANVKYSYLLLKLKKKANISKIQQKINDFQEQLKEIQIKTLTDLEAYMVVKERLKDAQDNLNSSKELLGKQNKTDEMFSHLAYATERILSAYSWAEFFGNPGKEFELHREALKDSCLSKLSEAEERFQYAKIFFADELKKTKKELNQAYHDFDQGQYELCIFRASKTKADANALLSLIGVEKDQLSTIIESKLSIVKQNIAEEQEKGIFPILGYSYYEYAETLKEDNQIASLLYLEYALELSNLDMYFKPTYELPPIGRKIELKFVLIFLFGALFGFALTCLIMKAMPRKKRRKQ